MKHGSPSWSEGRGTIVEILCSYCGTIVELLWKYCGTIVEVWKPLPILRSWSALHLSWSSFYICSISLFLCLCVSASTNVWSQRSGYGQSGCRQTQAATRRVSNQVVRVVAINSGGGQIISVDCGTTLHYWLFNRCMVARARKCCRFGWCNIKRLIFQSVVARNNAHMDQFWGRWAVHKTKKDEK